jgi:hypothetical protein
VFVLSTRYGVEDGDEYEGVGMIMEIEGGVREGIWSIDAMVLRDPVTKVGQGWMR